MKKKLILVGSLLCVAAPVAGTISCSWSAHETPKNLQTFKITNDSKDIDKKIVDAIENHFNGYVNEFAEAQALKSIHIFDASTSPYKDEGDYLPESNELIINTAIMSKYSNFTDDDKANYIMQLLAHEYNHFVDHSYLMNIDPTSAQAESSIHDWNNNGEVQPWPKAFLETFKKELKYNEDTNLYSSDEVSPGFVSLGSVYNQKQLFDMANGITDPSTLYTKLKGNEVMAPKDPIVEVSNHRIIKANSLSYIYSMDELFARKMQIVTSKYWYSSNFDKDGYFKTATGDKLESPYLQDVVNYQRGLNDFDNDGLYLQDKPNEEIQKLYDQARGIGSSQISFVEVKNDKYIQSDGTFKGTIDRDLIRFGGEIENDSDLKHIGYFEGENFMEIPINIVQRTDNTLINRDYLSDFISAKDILNKQLYFAKDSSGKDKVAINTMRDSKYGAVSTRRYLDTKTDTNYSFDNLGKLQTL